MVELGPGANCADVLEVHQPMRVHDALADPHDAVLVGRLRADPVPTFAETSIRSRMRSRSAYRSLRPDGD